MEDYPGILKDEEELRLNLNRSVEVLLTSVSSVVGSMLKSDMLFCTKLLPQPGGPVLDHVGFSQNGCWPPRGFQTPRDFPTNKLRSSDSVHPKISRRWPVTELLTPVTEHCSGGQVDGAQLQHSFVKAGLHKAFYDPLISGSIL